MTAGVTKVVLAASTPGLERGRGRERHLPLRLRTARKGVAKIATLAKCLKALGFATRPESMTAPAPCGRRAHAINFNLRRRNDDKLATVRKINRQLVAIAGRICGGNVDIHSSPRATWMARRCAGDQSRRGSAASHQRVAAVDGEDRAGCEAARVAGEVQSGPGHLVGPARPAERERARSVLELHRVPRR